MKSLPRISVRDNEHGNVTTIHDLTPNQRENVDIFKPGVEGVASQWRWKQGYKP